jgi:hypothetical protein
MESRRVAELTALPPMLLRGRDAEIDRGVILEDGRMSGALEICRLIENELATKACGRKSAARQRQQAALAVRYVHFWVAVSSRAEGLLSGTVPIRARETAATSLRGVLQGDRKRLLTF